MLDVRRVRLEKGLSVPALSKISGVPIRTIEDLEKRDDCKVSTLVKLALSLDVKLDEICKL